MALGEELEPGTSQQHERDKISICWQLETLESFEQCVDVQCTWTAYNYTGLRTCCVVVTWLDLVNSRLLIS